MFACWKRRHSVQSIADCTEFGAKTCGKVHTYTPYTHAHIDTQCKFIDSNFLPVPGHFQPFNKNTFNMNIFSATKWKTNRKKMKSSKWMLFNCKWFFVLSLFHFQKQTHTHTYSGIFHSRSRDRFVFCVGKINQLEATLDIFTEK